MWIVDTILGGEKEWDSKTSLVCLLENGCFLRDHIKHDALFLRTPIIFYQISKWVPNGQKAAETNASERLKLFILVKLLSGIMWNKMKR